MISVLHENATSGTAKNGYVAGYRVCGKTGTSEKVDKHRENPDEPMTYIASYCGFDPEEDPEYEMIVIFDEPNGASHYGSAVAGPVFQGIMSEILPYLGVTAEYTPEEAAKLNTVTPAVEGMTLEAAEAAAEEAGLSVKIIGDEENATVLKQIPAAGAAVPKDGMIVLYTSEEELANTVTVPNLVGYSLNDVLYLASLENLQVAVDGAALQSYTVIAYSQDIAEGTQVLPGTVITVRFIEQDQVQ